ncbi:MAG TPA: hypothetical protein EYH38_12265 [Leucothrix sp.]|nr:hypothetical protein [Leucothrix sp.]
MAEIPLLFVEKLANSSLLASFSASISEISPDFSKFTVLLLKTDNLIIRASAVSFVTESCKGLIA